MKIRVVAFSVVAIITIICVLVIAMNSSMSNDRLFSEEEIICKNIESIEVIEYKTNNQIVNDDENFIEQMSSVLKNLKSDNIMTITATSEEPLYVIYIKNIGYYPGGGIGIYEHHIEYKGRTQTTSSEESSSLIKLLKKEIQENS